MTTTQSWGHVIERFFIGLIGASITTVPPLITWMDSSGVWTDAGVKLTEAGTGIILVLCWIAALYVATREPEPHFYGCLFKAAGLPGILIGAAHVLQLSVR